MGSYSLVGAPARTTETRGSSSAALTQRQSVLPCLLLLSGCLCFALFAACRTPSPSPFPTSACLGNTLGFGRLHGDRAVPDQVSFVTQDHRTFILVHPRLVQFVFDPSLRIVNVAQGVTVAVEGDVVSAGGVEPLPGAAPNVRTVCDITRFGSGQNFPPTSAPMSPLPCANVPVLGRIHGDPARPEEIEFEGKDGAVEIGILTDEASYEIKFDPTMRVIDRVSGATVAVEGDVVAAMGLYQPGEDIYELCGSMTRLGSDF